MKINKLISYTLVGVTLMSLAAKAGPASIIELSADAHQPGTALVVNKSEKKLKVLTIESNSLKTVFTADVDIGKGAGDKIRRGDFKTPEGVYFLVNKKSPPEIPFETYGDLAFTTNYPNYFDILEGKTGNGIWLHAVPDTTSLSRGSKGCVVVRNDVIKSLQTFIKLRHTSLIILDEEKEIAEEERVQLKQKIENFVDSWRAAWESQDMPKYLNFYSEKFKGYGMNLNHWTQYKKSLSLKNKNTHIKQSNFNILRFKNQFVVLLSQNFESINFKDNGDKVLYIGSENNSLRILSEDFLRE